MIEDTELVLKTAGESYTTIKENLPVRLIPAHEIGMVANYHSPFDSHNVEYGFYSTQTELDTANIIEGDKVTSATTEIIYKLLTIITDETGWTVIQATKELS